MGSAGSKSARRLPKVLPTAKAAADAARSGGLGEGATTAGAYRPVQDLSEYRLPTRPSRDVDPADADAAAERVEKGAREEKPLSESIDAVLKRRATEARRPVGYPSSPSATGASASAAGGDAGGATNRPATHTVSDQGRDSYVDQDGKDPQFLQMLRGIGPVRYGERDAGRKAGLEVSGHAGAALGHQQTQAQAQNQNQNQNVQRADPLDGMWRARQRLAEEVARESGEDDGLVPSAAAAAGTSAGAAPASSIDRTAPVVRRHLEMSEIVAILDARKRGEDLSRVLRRFNGDASILDRLGNAVNTPTQIGETDDTGNAKAEWRDRV